MQSSSAKKKYQLQQLATVRKIFNKKMQTEQELLLLEILCNFTHGLDMYQRNNKVIQKKINNISL